MTKFLKNLTINETASFLPGNTSVLSYREFLPLFFLPVSGGAKTLARITSSSFETNLCERNKQTNKQIKMKTNKNKKQFDLFYTLWCPIADVIYVLASIVRAAILVNLVGHIITTVNYRSFDLWPCSPFQAVTAKIYHI